MTQQPCIIPTTTPCPDCNEPLLRALFDSGYAECVTDDCAVYSVNGYFKIDHDAGNKEPIGFQHVDGFVVFNGAA